MAVEGSGSLGSNESVKRAQAERLLADVYDLVVLLVGAYISNILAHLPVTLPPDIVRNISKLAIMHDSIMNWVTEALEQSGQQKERRPASRLDPVFDFKRRVDIAIQDTLARTGFDHALRTVAEASSQLASIEPDSPEWYQAKLMLSQAINDLLEASNRLVRQDAAIRAGSASVDPLEPVDVAAIMAPEDVARAPDVSIVVGPTVPTGQPVGSEIYQSYPTAADIDELADRAAQRPTYGQGGIAPTSGL